MYTLDKTLIDKFRKQIQNEVEELRYSVSQGRFDDILEYKKTCSKIDGLEVALFIFNQLVKTLGDENDEQRD